MNPSPKSRKIVNKFTKEIKLAYIETLKCKKKCRIIKRKIRLNSQVNLSDIKNNQFIDDTIKDHIYLNSNYSKELVINTLPIKEIKITIMDEFVIPNKYVYYIAHWLYFIMPYADKSCVKPLHIRIYLTPFKKLLPTKSKTIGPYNVNSGSTRVCTATQSTILIWRKEEWFKVLMHESFHYFQLDKFHHSHGSSKMKKLFHIESTFLMGEIYSETWATILHSIFYAFYKTQNIWTILELEKIHSINQTTNILQHMNLTYHDIISQHTNKYKEKTNVFCYYIGKMICLYHLNHFFTWCPKTLTCNKSLYLFIKKYYNNPTLLNAIQKSNQNPHSLKMCYSSIDIS
jgi:hypothetical protein